MQLPRLKATFAAVFGIAILLIMNISVILVEAKAQEIIGYSESKITVKSTTEEEEIDNICGSSRFQLTDAVLKDMNANRIQHAILGSQAVFESTIVSDCEFQNYPVFALFGFSREDGGTLIAIQKFTMNPDEQITISSSWMPEDTGKYELVIFLHSCLNCSGDFGAIERFDIDVIES